MTNQQAFEALKIFGDRAAASGLFKTVGDAVTYKEVVETLVNRHNEQHQMILDLNQMLESKPKNDG
jgi:hypothetical protein